MRPLHGLRRWWVIGLCVLAGCVSSEEFKGNLRFETVRSERTIDAHVRLETSHTLAPEVVDIWKAWLNSDDNIASYRQAMSELVYEDMVKSQVFASVNAPGRTEYDAVVRVESAESKSDHFVLRVTLKVFDAQGKALVAEYSRELTLTDSMMGFSDDMKRAMSQSLSSIRAQLLAEEQAGKGLRTLVAARRNAVAAQGRVAEAQAAVQRGDYQAAVAAVRSALQTDPQGAASVAAATELLYRLCDPETAKRLGEQGLKADPADATLQAAMRGTGGTPYPPACDAQALNREGVALVRAGQRSEALAKFQAARQAAPGLVAKASYNAALLLEQGGRGPEALAAYVEAYRSFLTPAEQQDALGRLVALTQRANLSAPDGPDRRYRLGIVRAQQKRYPEAIVEFEAALSDCPWLVDAYYNLGLVYDFTGASGPALQAFRAYLALAPSSPHTSAVKTKIVELEDKLGVGDPPPK
jgi:tetratricopeptide (TPR) repeat protein